MSEQLMMALIIGIPTGFCIALLLVMMILYRNVLGKDENRFERYSKSPINILSENECMSFLGMDSGIRWKNLKKKTAGMNTEESKETIDEAITMMKAFGNENAFCERMK